MNDQPVSFDRKQAQRAALLSIFAALGLIAAKLTAGLLSGSLSLLSEAAHSTLDAGATAVTYFAVRIASRPADEEHPYGHGKAENLSALLETVLLFGFSIYLAIEAVRRLNTGAGHPRATWYAFAVIVLSIIVDGSRSRILRRLGRKYRSPALQADALHFTADLMTSTVVLIGLVLVSLGYRSADAVGTLLIAGYVAISSIALGKKSVDVLMDRAPTASMERIEGAALAVEGVEEVRRVRLRYAGGQPQTDVVVAISRSVPLELAHAVTEEVERVIKSLEPGADVVVHVEPLADEQQITDAVRAIAARESRVSEVHNVFVTARPDGIHISLHAKLPGQMTLADAHTIIDWMEAEIHKEIPGITRVDTHLEPLELTEGSGDDVTRSQSTLVAFARAVAESEEQVENCHEVVITSSPAGLVVVMHCEAYPGLTIDEVHSASTRIEDEIHRKWSDVARVTVHFEPAEDR